MFTTMSTTSIRTFMVRIPIIDADWDDAEENYYNAYFGPFDTKTMTSDDYYEFRRAAYARAPEIAADAGFTFDPTRKLSGYSLPVHSV